MKKYENSLDGFKQYCKNNPLMFAVKPVHYVKNEEPTLYGDDYYIALSINPRSKEKSKKPVGTLGRMEGKVDVILRVYDKKNNTFKKFDGIEAGIFHAYFSEEIHKFAVVNFLFIEDLFEIK
jgi:hypothetical protein